MSNIYAVMSWLPFRPTPASAAVFLCVFGLVWVLGAWDLSVGVALIAAIVVAGLVVAGLRLLATNIGPGQRGTALLDLMLRLDDTRRGIRDQTTGLFTRWYLENRIDEEAARCGRYGYSMAVIVLKAVSLKLSQLSGDDWQEEATIAAKRCGLIIRNVDFSASLAPFEFALCLVQCDRAGAAAAVERVQQEFRQYDCSIGIAVYPEDDCEPRALIELARVRSRPVDVAAA